MNPFRTTRHLRSVLAATAVVSLTAGAVAATSGGDTDDTASLQSTPVEVAWTTPIQPAADSATEVPTTTNTPDAAPSDSTAAQVVETPSPAAADTPAEPVTETDAGADTGEPTDSADEVPTQPTDTNEPTDEVDEPALGKDAGAVTETGGVAEQPQHPIPPVPPVPAPSWGPVMLNTFDLPEPAFAVEQLPSEEIPTETPPKFGELSSNAFGCDSRCITRALLHPNPLSADLDIEIETTVATQMIVWVLPAGPYLVQGVPVHFGKTPYLFSDGDVDEWAATLPGLAYETTYRIVVGAIDQQDNHEYVTTLFTTVDSPADDFAGNGTGCYYQCITGGTAIPLPDHDEVDLEITTNTDVDFEIAVSTSEPGTIADHPFLPNDEEVYLLSKSPRYTKVRVLDLEPDTTYHVVVKVTDDKGQSQWATGEFTTDPAPPPPPPVHLPTDVFISFERIHVHHDGDNSGINSGEVSFTWEVRSSTESIYYGTRGTAKVDNGDSLPFAYQTGTWVSVPVDGKLPNITIVGTEQDFVSTVYECGPHAIIETPYFDESCDMTFNPAVTGELGLGFIESLAPCSDWGIDGEKANDRCIVVSAPFVSGDFVQFDTLISFHIA